MEHPRNDYKAQYLSDVHTHQEVQPFGNAYFSRFFFKLPTWFKVKLAGYPTQSSKSGFSGWAEDEDGDYISCRRNPELNKAYAFQEFEPFQEVITLEHLMKTCLNDVGFQVWPGALLLCDYLLHNQENFAHEMILDLGAGTGLTSIVAVLCCRNVIFTDYNTKFLELAKRNWLRNQDLLPIPTKPDDMQFILLDWKNNSLNSKDDNLDKDSQALHSATLIIAAEAIYDDELTDACFSTIYHLLKKRPEKKVIMTVEKREIFSSVSFNICSPAYEHFRENLDDIASVDQGNVRFSYSQIPIHEVPQYFIYARTKEMELWEISSSFTSQLDEKSILT